MEIHRRKCGEGAGNKERGVNWGGVEEVKERIEVKEMNEVEEVKERGPGENGARVAAFFDLDGTLVAGPSLERRFFRMLRYRRAIGVRNYFLWLGEAMRLAPRGIAAILQTNKMYLRGVRVPEGDGGIDSVAFSRDSSGSGRSGTARMRIPAFFPEAVERAAWHASQGHAIVIVSGTLEPLAREAARALEAQVARRGIVAEVHAIATRLEEAAGSWTGRIAGEVMFGEEKARAVRKLAGAWGLDLVRSYAYGDRTSDRWMLAAVGRPTAVNAEEQLRRIARLHDWPEMRWREKKRETGGTLPASLLAKGRQEEAKRGAQGKRQTQGKNEADLEKMKRLNAESLG
jgi:HAD superfamily phosphoserine phosphatase-like hydrolase